MKSLYIVLIAVFALPHTAALFAHTQQRAADHFHFGPVPDAQENKDEDKKEDDFTHE